MTDPLPPDLSVERIEELQAQCRNAFDLPQIRLSELSALLSLAHSAASGSEWRPIESAPKPSAKNVEPPAPRVFVSDGTSVSVAYWDWYYASGGYGFDPDAGDAWVEPFSGAKINGHFTPVYWKPLDPPPTKKEPENG